MKLIVICLLVLSALLLNEVKGVNQCYNCVGWITCEKQNIEECEDPDSLCVSNTYINSVGRIHDKKCVNSSVISTWQNDICPSYNSVSAHCYLCDTDLCNWLD